MIASPLLASFVSTRTTPPSVTNTVVLLPAPGILYRLSLIFSMVPDGGSPPPRPPPRWAATLATARPATTIAVRSAERFITPPGGCLRRQPKSAACRMITGLPMRADSPRTARAIRRRGILVQERLQFPGLDAIFP